jgi:glutamate carboxypeptidase
VPTLRERFSSTLPELLQDIGRLVECESPTGDPDAVARSATTVAEVGEGRLGVAPETLSVNGVTHLSWTFGVGPPRVLLLAHHDTVWPLGTLTHFPWSVTGGVARGPGCLDMKAGLAMALHALGSLENRDGVCLFVSGDEEAGSPSARPTYERLAPTLRAVLVTEPASDSGALKTSRAGVAHYELAVTGRAAHAGLDPENGVNATTEIASQVMALDELGRHSGVIVTPSVLRAGATTNTVPDTARLTVDVRAMHADAQAAVDRAITSLRTQDDRASLVVRRTLLVPPLEAARSDALFTLATSVAAEQGLASPERSTVGGGSDGNRLASLGVPTLDGLGAVGGGAHAEGEHVHVGSLADRTALLTGLLQRLQVAR